MRGSYPDSTPERTGKRCPDHNGPAQSSRWMSPKMCRGKHRADPRGPLRDGTYTAALHGADPASTVSRGTSFAPLHGGVSTSNPEPGNPPTHARRELKAVVAASLLSPVTLNGANGPTGAIHPTPRPIRGEHSRKPGHDYETLEHRQYAHDIA